MKIKRALLSVWDKDGIIELGNFLVDQNIEILSTGGTKEILDKSGLDTTSISFLTGSGSVMDGRVKTLHPKVFGGILADRENPQHIIDLEKLHGLEIDLVVVNFYPFVNEAVNKKLDFKKAIEFIDIGGPSMIRASAKNYHSVLPICNKKYYLDFINIYNENDGDIPLDFRKKMAKEVFSFSEKLGTLKISADDFSSLLLRFKNKVVAEIHLDFLQKPTSRSCKIIGSKGIIQWDYNGQSLKLFNYKNNTWKTVMNLKQFDLNQTYIDELIYFIKYVKNKKKTLNPLSDGIETLKIALNAKKSSKMKKVVMFND